MNRKIVIDGGSGGIGSATERLLAASGQEPHPWGAARRPETARITSARRIPSAGRDARGRVA
jgi:NAD(P)-dependent dehydrogenase (short-subunit alcohol dehydrogenase family)